MPQAVAEPRSEVRLKTNGFAYRGIDVSPLDRELYTNDIGEQAFALSQKSGELRNKVGLYFLGRDAELGLNTKEIQKLLESGELTPEDVEMTKAFYRDCQARRKGELPPRGHVHSNLVILEPNATIPGTRKPGEDYIVGIFFENTNGYDENEKVIETNDTRETKLWLPPTGIVVPTRYGMFNEHGLPEDVIPNNFQNNETTKKKMETAKQRLTEAGLPESELMNFYRWDTGSVVVWSVSDPVLGALCVGLGDWHWGRYGGCGSFPASGSPSRARRVSEKEYKRMERKLRTTEKNMQEAQGRLQAVDRALKGKG